MPFPVSIRGDARVTDSTPDQAGRQAVLTRLRVRLLSEGASKVEVGGASLSFSVRWLRWRSNWNILAPYDRGRILVVHEGDGLSVEYDFSTRRLAIIVTFMCAILGLLIALGGPHKPLSPLIAMAAGWVWLFGVNYMLARIRLGSWMRRVINR
jgi:hypothetical protein